MFTKFYTLNIFFQKFDGRVNLLSIFLTFDHFCEKFYEKTYQSYELFSNFLSLCAHSQNFVSSKFLLKKRRLFQNVSKYLFLSATLSDIGDKTFEKTYHYFLHIFKVRLNLYTFTKFHDHQIK